MGSIDQPRILDATAGYGRDGVVLAALGAHVTLAERLPDLSAALHAAHAALAQSAPPDWVERVVIHSGDARELLHDTTPGFDVIYLDPMYAAAGERARAKAPIEALRQRTGGDDDADTLANQAWEHARRRLVVKRSPKAPALLARKPSYVLKSNRVRFDIYVKC